MKVKQTLRAVSLRNEPDNAAHVVTEMTGVVHWAGGVKTQPEPPVKSWGTGLRALPGFVFVQCFRPTFVLAVTLCCVLPLPALLC